MNSNEKIQDLGRRLFFEHFRAGNPCLPVLQGAFRSYGKPSFQVFVGAMSAAMGLLASTFESGVRFRSNDTRVNGVIQQSPTAIAIAMNRGLDENDLIAVSEIVIAVAGAVDGLQGKVTVGPDTDPQAKPLEVIVKSMPERETETSIRRDDNGDIVGSSQVERDMA